MSGISALGAYLPRIRLEKSAISDAMKWLNPELGRLARGTRSLGFWDEDAVTMAVAACRDCLGPSNEIKRPHLSSLTLASNTLPFAQPQNAALVASALRLQEDCRTQDVSGTPRAALIALHQHLEDNSHGLIVASDRNVSPAGSKAEMMAGDGAAAIAVGPADAHPLGYLGGSSITSPFIDEYREPAADWSTHWEERWIRDQGILQHVPSCIQSACKAAGVAEADVDWFIMPSKIANADGAVAKVAGLQNAKLAESLNSDIGDCGSAHPILMLANCTHSMKPGDTIVMAAFGQGATALVFEAGKDIDTLALSFTAHLSNAVSETNYTKLPVFSGMLSVDSGIRARMPSHEALSVAYRYADALLGFVGGRCAENGEVMFPPSKLSVNTQRPSLDTQQPWPLADLGGTIASLTQDSLAYSPHPPSCYGLVDFSGGGRLMMDFTDVDAPMLQKDDAVDFAFRIKDRNAATGFHRYFWKAIRANNQPSKAVR